METRPEFNAHCGLVAAMACTSLPVDEATRRINLEHPTGIASSWEPIEGETPARCDDNPDTHIHLMFEC